MNQTPECLQPTFTEKSVTLAGLAPIVETVLWKNPTLTWDQLAKETLSFNPAFIAFTFVRTQRGHEIVPAGPWIGIEGYPAHIWTADEIVMYEKRHGRQLLETIARATKFDATRRHHVESTLWENCDYIDALRLFDELIGSELGRLRALPYQCQPEQRRLNTLFREQTYRQTAMLHVSYRYSPNEGVTMIYPKSTSAPNFPNQPSKNDELGSYTLLRMMQIATTPIVRMLLRHAV